MGTSQAVVPISIDFIVSFGGLLPAFARLCAGHNKSSCVQIIYKDCNASFISCMLRLRNPVMNQEALKPDPSSKPCVYIFTSTSSSSPQKPISTASVPIAAFQISKSSYPFSSGEGRLWEPCAWGSVWSVCSRAMHCWVAVSCTLWTCLDWHTTLLGWEGNDPQGRPHVVVVLSNNGPFHNIQAPSGHAPSLDLMHRCNPALG